MGATCGDVGESLPSSSSSVEYVSPKFLHDHLEPRAVAANMTYPTFLVPWLQLFVKRYRLCVVGSNISKDSDGGAGFYGRVVWVTETIKG